MRAETVHVTDHALLRWKERAAKHEDVNVYEIIRAVKESKVIKKTEPLPYPLPRLDGSVYSFHDGVLFVMEPITIDEYRLVTVICESVPYCGIARPKPPKHSEKKKKMERLDVPTFDSAIEERNWLIETKRHLEKELAATPKKDNKRKELLLHWSDVESRLIENKPKFIEERDILYAQRKKDNYIDYGIILKQILQELQEMRSLIEARNVREQQGPPGNRATTGFVHVQSALTRLPDLAAQGHDCLQLAAEPDSAA